MDDGVKVSSTSGASWSTPGSGLPGYIAKGLHNQIAVSPCKPARIYWAFNHGFWKSSGDWEWQLALYRSLDCGGS